MNKSVRFGSVRLPRWWVQVGGVAMVGLLSFACSSDADVPSAQGGAAGGGGKAGSGGGGKAGSAGGGQAGQSSSQGGGGQANGGTGNVGNGGTSGNSSVAGGPSGGSGGNSIAGSPSGGSGGNSIAGSPSGGGGNSGTAGGPSGGSGGDSTAAGGPSGGSGGTSTAGGPSGGSGGTSTAGGPSGGSGGTSTAGGPSGGSGGTAQAGAGGAQGGSGGSGGAQGGSGGAAPTAFLKWQNGYVDGASNTGNVQGYWYTFTGGSSSVISESPPFGTAAANICVFGSAAQQAGGSGSTVGFNTNQIAGTGTAANAWNATSHSVGGIEFVLTGSQVPAAIQIDVKVKDSANSYCLVRTGVTSGGAQTIPFAAVQQDCRTSGGSHPAPDATKIEAIHFQIPTSATSSTGFNFCVTSIKLL